MNHPELILVPLLMLADYVLTILGAKTSELVYRKHFLIPTYEMNPVWRKSVDQIRWFNPRHFAAVVLVTVILFALDLIEKESSQSADALPFDFFELLLGMLFGAFGSVCGRHLSNLLQFRYLNRHPEEISGHVQLSMILVLKISQFGVIGLIPLSILVAALVPCSYTVGVALGLTLLVIVHFLWMFKAKSAEVESMPALHSQSIDSETPLPETP